ncbi:MAG: L-threonine 3-dehydrogenase [Acholeplasmatales bacterium]|jgi:threonine 3-dehydrogenase|nr:L-threonine 3-dehydrogenase [Acholeplasmataceae bacterium]MDY0115564.1 L-threonine 3-dehydrogenase [Acholeplasmatales bacterium]MCK9233741.1 L-threonine 3-dehydrogenase [Acholeplasmataceae bacterium]MCK9289023.1 L-threonine 3-dehydrogenase [Acholeplasmataceae bacterium]MCK9427718.1 L-threonine 3-dehydrogenase [Acholeplasmataceae bacterium]
MKAYIKAAPKPGFELVEKAIPKNIADNEVLIKVLSVSLCGTDVHIYNWDNWAKNRIKPPLTIGHEFSGEVVSVGKNVSRVKIGDIVASETHVVCGVCEFCRRGEAHICENTKVIGVDIDGAFAEYIKMPEANLYVDKSGLDHRLLSVLEPLGNAVHTTFHFDVAMKEVVVLGCGPIGLMSVDLLKASGAKKIIAIETNQTRIKLAKELGADVVIDALNEDVVKRVLEETNGGAEVVLEFSGNDHAFNQALEYLKPGGKMAILGVFSKDALIDLNKVVFKGITLYGVTGRKMYQNWQEISTFLETKKLHLEKIVTHYLKFSEMDKAFEIMKNKDCGKVVLTLKEE